MADNSTGDRLDELKKRIAGRRSMLVAFSGGIDSTLLAAIATEVLGRKVHSVLIDSPLVSRSAVCEAERIARVLGLSFEIIREAHLDCEIRMNPPDRCYYCKRADAKILKKRAQELGLECVADGVNISDMSGHRPGIAASSEEGIVHPFIEAGITKEDIRSIARDRGYDFWDKPSDACLASRIPYGEEISDENLRRIEAAEDNLHRLGFRVARVRMHSGMARIEVDEKDIERIAAMREEITRELSKLGFSYIALDLEGYRSGSMDEVLPG